MRFVMMFGFSASCWLEDMAGSLDWKVNSVAGVGWGVSEGNEGGMGEREGWVKGRGGVE